jgi:hypothetical protein
MPDPKPIDHQMLDAVGAPGSWPQTLMVDRLSALFGELERCRETLDRIAAIDPYNMPPNGTCPSREAQNWATLNGCVSWAREARASAPKAKPNGDIA